jgi:hypothetical protein
MTAGNSSSDVTTGKNVSKFGFACVSASRWKRVIKPIRADQNEVFYRIWNASVLTAMEMAGNLMTTAHQGI